MDKSLQDHLQQRTIYNTAKFGPEFVSLNTALEYAKKAKEGAELEANPDHLPEMDEKPDHVAKLETVDHRLIGLLNSKDISEERKRVIMLVLRQVQDMYECESEHEIKREQTQREKEKASD